LANRLFAPLLAMYWENGGTQMLEAGIVTTFEQFFALGHSF
jgi:hypothetical protein